MEIKSVNAADIHNNSRYSKEGYLNDAQSLFDNSKWLTTKEAAFYLRRSINAIHILVSRGKIRARKFQRRLYFKRAELDYLIETSSTGGV